MFVRWDECKRLVFRDECKNEYNGMIINCDYGGINVNCENDGMIINPHQNDQGRKGPCFYQRLIALKCLKCQKIKKNI